MATKRQKPETVPAAVFQVATMPEDLAASDGPTTADSAGVQHLRAARQAAGADPLDLDVVDLAGPVDSPLTRLNVTREELLAMVGELGRPITPQLQTEAAAPPAAVVEATVPPMPDVLAALGWSFEQHADGWHGVHAAAQVTTPGFIDRDLAIQAALMLERSVTNPRVTGDSWVNQLRAARTVAAAPDAVSAPAIPDDLAALGWALESSQDRPRRWVPVHAAAGIRTTWAYPDPAEAIAFMRETERHAADPTFIASRAANALRPFRQQPATDDPPRRSTPAAPFWAHGPSGRSANAAHLWDEVDPYTWRSRCGKYTFAERKPDGDPGGNRCPVCVEREHAAAPPPESAPPEVQPMTTETESLPLDHIFAVDGPDRRDVAVDAIIVGRFQPRTTFSQAAIDELAASIQEHGILNRLQVIHNEYGQIELVAGERRLRAARQLGLATVPVEIRAYTLAQVEEVSLLDNLQRQDLSPLDEGTAYEGMIQRRGISENALSKQLGVSRARIQQYRALARSAPEVQQALRDGALTFTVARAVALTAPGNVAIQQAALKKIEKQQGNGVKVSEEQAKTWTEEIVQKKTTKLLQQLGWSVFGSTVWSATDRPARWTGAEMLAAVEQQRRPSDGTPIDTKVASKVLAVVERQYRLDQHHYAPWTQVMQGYGQEFQSWFKSPDELAQLVAEVEQTQAAMEARFQKAGWTLTHDSQRNYKAVSGQGRKETCYDWPDVRKLIARIESGEVTPERAPPLTTSHQPQKQSCQGCNKKVVSREYIEDRYLCADCTKQVKAVIAARQAAIRANISEVAATWLNEAPVEALRLIMAAATGQGRQRLFGSYHLPSSDRAQKLQAADAALLRETVLDWLAYNADNERKYPAVPEVVQVQPAEATA